jgi:hypothetical protein
MATAKRTHPLAVYDDAALHEISDTADAVKVICAAALGVAGIVMGANDASETMVFARQLETIRNKVYEKKYPEYKGRSFVPVASEDGDSEYLTYRVWDEVTMSKVIADYATDFATVTAMAFELTTKFFDIGNAYDYDIKDLRRAAKAGLALETKLAGVARRGIELGIDDAIALGVPSLKTFGLVNHPNVTLLTLTTGTWASATGAQIVADMNQLVTNIMDTTLEIWTPDTFLCSTDCLRFLQTKIFDASGGAGTKTVLDVFKEQNPTVTVASWNRLNTANAAGTNGRIVVYKKDSEVLEFIMGREFEIFPAVQTGLRFTHPCMATVGGVQVHHPAAILYADNQTM